MVVVVVVPPAQHNYWCCHGTAIQLVVLVMWCPLLYVSGEWCCVVESGGECWWGIFVGGAVTGTHICDALICSLFQLHIGMKQNERRPDTIREYSDG